MTNFSLTYNGLTITLNNLATNGIAIDHIEGIDGLGVRVSADTLTGQNGGVVWNRLYEMRNIAIEGWIDSPDGTLDSYWEAKSVLVNAFSITTNTDLSITRWGETTETKSIKAYVIGMPMIVEGGDRVDNCKWRVEFLCPESFFTDGTSTNYTISLATGGGTPIAFPVPTPVGSLTGGYVIINNEGDIEAYPTNVRILGPVTNPIISNSTTGKSFQLTTTITATNYVDLYRNNEGFFVYYNGSTPYYQYFSGDFFKLAKGNNTIRFGSSVYDASALATITWKNNFNTLYG